MTQTRPSVPPVPPHGRDGPERDAVTRARTVAVDAAIAADNVEHDARQLRREANQLRKIYERLLMEYSGQMTIDDVHNS